MIIKNVKIENFRNIKKYCIDIHKNVVLVRSRDINTKSYYLLGKTNFLNAILWCFNRTTIYSGVDANIDSLNNFKSKKIDEVNVSVIVTFKDKRGRVYKAKRVVTYSYEKKNNKSFKTKDGYYKTQEFSLNEEIYNLFEYLEKIKKLQMPYFVDDFKIYNFTNYKKIIKKYINQAKGNQIFIVSYDDYFKEPILSSVLNKLNINFEELTIKNVT